uniref:GIY-YIG endonuclease n=1 Tax=Fusarium ficicrescens TaxID=1688603 RepID=A0A6M4B1J3_9HYPO|nr:GIY-YIG endonuclease [Fusarium ficicrescens]
MWWFFLGWNSEKVDNVKWYDLNQYGYMVNSNKKVIFPLLEKGGIYIYKLSLGEGEKFYVGSSINIKQRFRQHKYRSLQHSVEYNSILYRYVLKYGWQNFNFGVLEYIDFNKSDSFSTKRKVLCDIEQRYLDIINPSLNINKFAGSMKGYKHNAETKNNYSKARTGKCYRNIKGVIIRPEISQETIIKLKLSGKSLKVKILDKDKEEAGEFNSLSDLAKSLDISTNSVRKFLKSEKLWNNLYYFKFDRDGIARDHSINLSFPLEELETNSTKLENINKLDCLNFNRRADMFEVLAGDKIIYRFKSITKASQYLNISRRTLTMYSKNNKLWKDKFAFNIVKSTQRSTLSSE